MAAGCSHTKGFVPPQRHYNHNKSPNKTEGCWHPETLPKGYNPSYTSCRALECIWHRSVHLLSVSAFLVQERLCCSKHIALFPLSSPRGCADWERDRCSTLPCRFSTWPEGQSKKGKNKVTSQLTRKNFGASLAKVSHYGAYGDPWDHHRLAPIFWWNNAVRWATAGYCMCCSTQTNASIPLDNGTIV